MTKSKNKVDLTYKYVKINCRDDFARLLELGYGRKSLRNPWEYYSRLMRIYGPEACVDITYPYTTIQYAPEYYYISKGYIKGNIDELCESK